VPVDVRASTDLLSNGVLAMNRWALAGVFVVGLVAGGCRAGGPDCGDRFCDSRFETAGSCPADCGGTVCGDGFCEAGENCSTCRSDCGDCAGCGDGLCQTTAGENCTSCRTDCGACTVACGDGLCRAADGESCSTCVSDCGACGGTSDPYETCTGAAGCALARDACTSITNRTATRSMCTTSCSSDGDCDDDMFGSPGDCVTFSGSSPTCFHRCVDSSDCYPGFACYAPTGSTGALGTICLPDAGPPVPSVQPYRQCTDSSECVGGLQCINYTVGSASQDLCSSSPCVNDDDCPFDSRGGRGACLSFAGGVRACWERCNVRADCPNMFDFDCNTAVGGFTSPVPICVPR
jgi:hypothetical protein